MSYEHAHEIFKDNVTIMGKPQTKEEKILWNLGEGLAELTETLSQDIREIKQELHRLSQGQ